jgi:hypothetical protein
MYTFGMKRLEILIEDELDAALEREAASEGTSKAALILRYVGERVCPLPPLPADPLSQMAGLDDFEPASVDRVVYR